MTRKQVTDTPTVLTGATVSVPTWVSIQGAPCMLHSGVAVSDNLDAHIVKDGFSIIIPPGVPTQIHLATPGTIAFVVYTVFGV